MKRFAVCTLLLSFAFKHFALADSTESNVSHPRHAAPPRPVAARPAVNPGQPQRPNIQAPGLRNFQAQSYRSLPEAWTGRVPTSGNSMQPRVLAGNFNPSISRQPRILAQRPSAAVNPSGSAVPQPNRVTDPVSGRGVTALDRARSGDNADLRDRIDRNRTDRNRDSRSGTPESQNRGTVGGDRTANGERHRSGDRHHNWNGDGSHGSCNWDRSHHDRNWWHSRFNRFAFFGGGCYYLNAGYWFPAYGYNPYFTSYTYDAPLYAYNNLDPADVIANVQEELQRLGYYQDEIDGDYGPTTRQALLDYQRDNGLPETGEIDESTLGALGFE